MTRFVARAIATFLFVGYFPLGPGSVAAAITLALWIVVPPAGLLPNLALWVVLIPAGIWASGRVEADYGHDSSRVVIDEVAGSLLTVAGFAPGAGIALAGFVLFRFFDIVKPPPIYQMQSYPGGWGVMVDDLAAGIAGNLCLRLLGFLAPGSFAALAGFGGHP
jgi:phosphatidylglycerophosphatase A